jgi:predicted Zn-dependent protease
MRIQRAFRPAAAAFAALFALNAGGCATNPATGERQLSLISESQEIQMGQQSDQAVIAQLGLYPDSAVQRYVRTLGLKLAALSERPSLPWTFRVVDDPSVNAFALPGGFIYVTRGIMAYLESEAQLVSVLGHEIGHVTARHSVSQASKQQLAQIGLVVGSIISPTVAQAADVASAGLGLLFLKYGRDDENQADELGLRYMARGNYDPRQMPGVFTLLERVSQQASGGRTPEWLSTHPDPGNRREHINGLIAQLPSQNFSNTIVDQAQYLNVLDNIVYGVNPREGFFRGNEFLHPDLRFRFTFPQGWQHQNQKQAVLAVSPNQDAIIQISAATENSSAAAAQSFFGQQGISGTAARGTVNGLTAAGGSFSAQTEQGVLQGDVTFIEYGGMVYQVLAYGPQSAWGSYQNVARNSVQSFGQLTDQSALNAQPMRLDVMTLPRAMSFSEFARQYAGPVDANELALLNQVDTNASLQAGRKVKRVVGERP